LNDILKQRLVGALILVALGVVFWPIIFVEPGGRPEADQARIPPRPEVDTTPIEPPDQVGLRPPQQVLARDSQLEEGGEPESVPQPALEPVPEPAPVPEPVPVPEPEPVAEPAPQKRTRSESPEKLAMDSQGVPVAWILQVASVSSADKAEQLRQSLLQKDRKAYTRKIRRNGKDLYRVYIGPKFERGRLEAMQAEVDREFGVKSMIVRYIP
jgi:DedD protein